LKTGDCGLETERKDTRYKAQETRKKEKGKSKKDFAERMQKAAM